MYLHSLINFSFSYLEHSSQIDDPDFDRVGTISKLPQAVCFLLVDPVVVVFIELSTIIEYDLNLGIVMLYIDTCIYSILLWCM